jgi:hypothetical protein
MLPMSIMRSGGVGLETYKNVIMQALGANPDVVVASPVAQPFTG